MEINLFGADKLNFVEFNITGDNETCIRCDDESFFLDTRVFNLFIDCFENSNKIYEYFGPTKYNSRLIIPLKNNLEQRLRELNEISTKEDFINFINERDLGFEFKEALTKQDMEWRKNWQYYLHQLTEINTGILKVIEKCIDDVRVLWTIGY